MRDQYHSSLRIGFQTIHSNTKSIGDLQEKLFQSLSNFENQLKVDPEDL